MAHKDIIVIGASSGGIEALRTLVGALPKDFAASVFVVLHMSADSPGLLGGILRRSGALPASNATDRAKIKPGRVYVAPPDHHLLVDDGFMRITHGPKENRFRPAVDPLFRSAARVYGTRVIGVVLTGALDDGTAGLSAIKACGGIGIVQDPADAEFPSMPQSALDNVAVDYRLPIAGIAPQLVQLVAKPALRGVHPMPEKLDIEVNIAAEQRAIDAGVQKLGRPSSYACPECHGVLLRVDDSKPVRFRCHTGHAYSTGSLLAEQTERAEEALWSAIRVLDESALLLGELSQTAQVSDPDRPAAYREKRDEAKRHANIVRQTVFANQKLSPEKAGEES